MHSLRDTRYSIATFPFLCLLISIRKATALCLLVIRYACLFSPSLSLVVIVIIVRIKKKRNKKQQQMHEIPS